MRGLLRFEIFAALAITGAVAWAPSFYLLSEAEYSREQATISPALVMARNSAMGALKTSFVALTEEVRQRAISPATKNALHDFEEAVYLVSEDLVIAGSRLRAKYGLDKTSFSPTWGEAGYELYEKVYDKHNPTFLSLASRYQLADIAIFEAGAGFCLYSSNKDGFLGKSIIAPPAGYEKVAETVALTFAGNGKDSIFTSFYSKKGKGATAYLSAPISIDGKVAGALVFTVTDEIIKSSINSISSPAGYLFHSSVIRLLDNKKVASNQPDASAPEFISPPALATTSGVAETKTGIAAFAPISLGNEEYAVIVESKTSGTKERASRASFLLLVTLGPALVAILLLFTILNSSIFPKIKALSSALENLAKTGEATDEAVMAAKNKNEMGRLFELVTETAMMIDQKDKEANANREALLVSIEAMEKKLVKGGGSTGWRKLADLSQKEADSLSEKSGLYESKVEELSGRLNAANEKLRENKSMEQELVKSFLPRLVADIDMAIKEAKSAKEPDRELCAALERAKGRADSLFTKISGRSALHTERMVIVDIASLANRAAESFRPEAEKKGVALAIDIKSTETRSRADGDAIGLVISQLLDNAIRFTPKGGEVALVVSNVESMVLVEVFDTGAGVEKSDREKIFERYYRGRGAEDVFPGGRGEGLWFCRGVIKEHDGKIGMRVRGEVGSVFFFSLPKSSGPEQRSLF